MIVDALVVVALAALLVLVWHTRRTLDPEGHRVRHPKGAIGPGATLQDAIGVAERHLPAARTGANMRLQYGHQGCLTIIRRAGGDKAGFLVRWEFWHPNPELAARALDIPAGDLRRPSRDVLELSLDDDYLAVQRAINAVFDRMTERRNDMHLTWNC